MPSKVEIDRHLNILLEYQHPSGGFPASPTFPPYRYCWFRDGSFTAHALELYGKHEAAHRFHQWCVDTILRHAHLLESTRDTILRGDLLKPEECFPCRFSLDGQPLQDGWGNHQLDGLGTWLWAVSDHLERSPCTPPAEWQHARALTASFLQALWRFPCYDCWEEHPHDLHTYSLAAAYGGLQAHGRTQKDPASTAAAGEIHSYVLKHGVVNGRLAKRFGSEEIDASLLGAALPFGLLDPASVIMTRTLQTIEDQLTSPSGGVHRYQADTYYGGGEWILLTAWKGWLHARRGELDQALQALAWVQGSVDANGYLPEQTSRHLLAPDFLPRWEQQWGSSASPLLWSHSMALILKYNLLRVQEDTGRSWSNG
ncbi:MAG: glycoside hydrolase family 15 protein [Anaerolineales bacterium]|nr:glycoside hydrolase family 15 protein [Anaerolineales bacterium]